MHDLSLDFTALPGSFTQCVMKGKSQNAKLREQFPDAPFLKDETVVRVTLAPLSACYADLDRTNIKNANETKNPVYKSFLSYTSGCSPVLGDLPEDLAKYKQASNYRGMILGK